MSRSTASRIRRVTALLLIAATGTCAARTSPDHGAGWHSPGLIGNGGWPFARAAVTPEQAAGASYIPGSTVLALSGRRALLIPFGRTGPMILPQDDPRVRDAVRSDRDWLASGRVTGRSPRERAAAERALLDLRLLTLPNGASTASWYDSWNYVWPRDGAFAAAAFVVTGHGADARRVLSFLAGTQAADGLWAARYRPDGTVSDSRATQLDSLGWVLWATWLTHATDPEAADLTTLWPMVRRAADRASKALRADGLPAPSPDYWERSPSDEQAPHVATLGVCAPMLTGLRAAASLAAEHGDGAAAARWRRAADRLDAGIRRRFAPYGYPRSPIPHGAVDSSITFLAPPFAPAGRDVPAALRAIRARLRIAGGGTVPGEGYGAEAAWTPEAGLFALAAVAGGDTRGADEQLTWLLTHRTSLGSFPEKVDTRGRQAGVAPLGWTSALVVLALTEARSPLPIPPP